MVKKIIKKIVPENLWVLGHHLWALGWAAIYGRPADKMIIIGITGTKGKTSVGNILWSVLQTAGLETGLISTAIFRFGEQEELNPYHVTMPKPRLLQGLLARMYRAGCRAVVLEVTSEGLKLWRHAGINFDIVIFTNLTPEHLPNHGHNFENYKLAKARLFEALHQGKRKNLGGELIHKAAIINFDDIHGHFYLGYPVDRQITYGLNPAADYAATKIENTPSGLSFQLGPEKYLLNILGRFNVYNALPAIACAEYLGLPRRAIRAGLARLATIPGRMEKIDLGQPFVVLVDYAHETRSTEVVLTAGRELAGPDHKVIILLGAVGGGRDTRHRPAMGELAAKKADYLVVSDVDPFEDDPVTIAEEIAAAAETAGLVRDQNLFVITDRRAGIHQALSLATPGDVVIIAGKGAEQTMLVGKDSILFDERVIVREELAKVFPRS
jgi:UDP-N-acetylmuramoyl-L-alanyl-D-glutamate--2,6-diaminopimelate ligase